VEGLSTAIHVAHAILAGVWLGGVVFTTAVVSPALKAMKWSEPERVLVRSRIGERYAKVGSVNLALLALFAALDGLIAGFGPIVYAEYAMLIALAGLVVAHGAYFGRRLKELADAERRASDAGEARAIAERRRSLQKSSLKASWANILVSLAAAALAVSV
jgi:putative copper export protein